MRPLSIRFLRRRAAHASNMRGHRLRWVTRHYETGSIAIGECTRCDASVTCTTRPLIDGIDIGGNAVAVQCTGTAVAR